MVVAPEPMSNGAEISNYISYGSKDLKVTVLVKTTALLTKMAILAILFKN